MENGTGFISSALLGENSSMVSAVASLLARQQVMKDEAIGLNTPMLVLTNSSGKDAMQASVVLDSNPEHGTTLNKSFIRTDLNPPRESLVASLEQVHALATANLLASTQRDIAQQLAEASTISQAVKGSELKSRKPTRVPQRKGKGKRGCLNEAKDQREDGIKLQVSQSKTSSPPPPKALECSFKGCNRKFAWLTHLKYHELTHTNNRQFECPDENCGKSFFTAQRLKVHLRTHTGERPFKCFHVDCGKTFTTAGNLKNHERLHTGEQPFVCDYADCNRRFTEDSSLRKHKLTHSGDKPFKCKICDKKFTQSGSRRQHLIRHHLDDEIRNSLKSKSSVEEEDNLKRKSENQTDTLNMTTKNTEGISSLSNGPRVMLLKNAYQGLGEHMVAVTTQTARHHQLLDKNTLSLSQTLLNTDGLHDDPLSGKSDELVVLSENPIYRQEEHSADIVYTSGILDHEEVTHSDYVSSQVEYSEGINSGVYSQTEAINSDVNLSQQGMTPSNIYHSHEGYIHGGNLQHVNDFVETKDISHAYLNTEGEIMSEDFIGAEEVTVSHYHTIPSSEENLGTTSQYTGSKGEDITEMDPLMEWDDHLHKP